MITKSQRCYKAPHFKGEKIGKHLPTPYNIFYYKCHWCNKRIETELNKKFFKKNRREPPSSTSQFALLSVVVRALLSESPHSDASQFSVMVRKRLFKRGKYHVN